MNGLSDSRKILFVNFCLIWSTLWSDLGLFQKELPFACSTMEEWLSRPSMWFPEMKIIKDVQQKYIIFDEFKLIGKEYVVWLVPQFSYPENNINL